MRVFSDGSTTAQIDAVIMRNGAKLKNISVMAHLHVGACFDPNYNDHPDFDSRVCAEHIRRALEAPGRDLRAKGDALPVHH